MVRKKIGALFFSNFISGTVAKLSEPPKTQSELTAEFWSEIVSRRYEFQLKKQKIKVLETLDLESVRGFSENFIVNPKTRKRLR